MKKLAFPMNYFSVIFSPVRMFIGRSNLSWGNILFIFIFLQACLILPVSVHFAKANSFELKQVMPGTMDLIDQPFVDQLSSYSLHDGVLSGGNGDVILKSDSGVAMISLNGTTAPDADNAIIMKKSEMELKDKAGYTFKVKYTNNTSLSNIESPTDLINWISSQWYTQNKAFLFITMILMVGSILVGSALMLILFTSLFLWMTKHSSFSSISTFKEALNLTMNALGLPTLLSMIAGLIFFDITIIIAIQSLGMVLMVAFIFFKTRFSQDRAMQICEIGGRLR
jgi:maltodextrin utilization protein YvdJ